jgi:hypothetical protein
MSQLDPTEFTEPYFLTLMIFLPADFGPTEVFFIRKIYEWLNGLITARGGEKKTVIHFFDKLPDLENLGLGGRCERYRELEHTSNTIIALLPQSKNLAFKVETRMEETLVPGPDYVSVVHT